MKPRSLLICIVFVGMALVALGMLTTTPAQAGPVPDKSGPEDSYVRAQAAGDAWLPGPDLSACFDLTRFDAEYYNGYIYVLGGRSGSDTDGSIYRVNPYSGNCNDTGVDMPTPVSNYTINLVNNGTANLLCTFGGRDSAGTATLDVQCFNPGASTATVVATLPIAYIGYFPGGTAVVDNRVYVFGGYNSGTAPYVLASTYRFNPLDLTFTQLGDLSLARAYINTAVVDGKIYAFGGDSYDSISLVAETIAEVMADPGGAGTWDDAAVADLPTANGEGRAWGFDSDSIYGLPGKVILAGGGIWPNVTAEVLAYDVATNTYDASFPDLITARRNQAGVFVPLTTADPGDGLPGLWVLGGRVDYDTPPYAPAEYYPLVSPPLWQAGPDLSTCFDLTRIDAEYYPGTEKVYILGGRTGVATVGDIFSFDPVTGDCADTGVDMPTPISNYTINMVNNGTADLLCTFGGRDSAGAATLYVQCFNPGANTATVVATLPIAYIGYFPGGTAVVDNQVVVFGGYNSAAAPYTLASTYRFNPLDNTFTQLGNLNLARGYINTAVVDGKIYALGGHTYDGGSLTAQTIVEVMADPGGAGTWDDAAVADLPTANAEGRAFGFDSDSGYNLAGKIILAGGGGWPNDTAAALAYDVASDTYDTIFPDLITSRRNHAGAFVPLASDDPDDGLPGMWVFGGRSGSDVQPFAGAEYYPMSVLPAQIAATPLGLDVSVYEGTSKIETLSVQNVGYLPLDWTMLEFTATQTAPESGCVVALLDSSYLTETQYLVQTLEELGYSWTFVDGIGEAADVGADVFVDRYAAENAPVYMVDAWLANGYGYIHLGDWPDWFANSWEAAADSAPLAITVADSTHPLAAGLPASWEGRGFWSYEWDQDAVGWATNAAYPSIIDAQYTVLRERVVTGVDVGLGRAVYIGVNVYGPAASENDMRLLDNAIRWSGRCNLPVDVPWLAENPVTGTVTRGGSTSINVTFDPSGLAPGIYYAALGIDNSDPDQPLFRLPVRMTVLPLEKIFIPTLIKR